MANTQILICTLDDHYPIQLFDDLYHITVSLEKVVRLLPDQPGSARRKDKVVRLRVANTQILDMHA